MYFYEKLLILPLSVPAPLHYQKTEREQSKIFFTNQIQGFKNEKNVSNAKRILSVLLDRTPQRDKPPIAFYWHCLVYCLANLCPF